MLLYKNILHELQNKVNLVYFTASKTKKINEMSKLKEKPLSTRNMKTRKCGN